MGNKNIRLLKQRFYITAPAHDIKALYRIQKLGIKTALVTPVFPTNSHASAPGMGLYRLRKIVNNKYKTDIYAMGGVNFQNMRFLPRRAITGIAGIDLVAQLPQRKPPFLACYEN